MIICDAIGYLFDCRYKFQKNSMNGMEWNGTESIDRSIWSVLFRSSMCKAIISIWCDRLPFTKNICISLANRFQHVLMVGAVWISRICDPMLKFILLSPIYIISTLVFDLSGFAAAFFLQQIKMQFNFSTADFVNTTSWTCSVLCINKNDDILYENIEKVIKIIIFGHVEKVNTFCHVTILFA